MILCVCHVSCDFFFIFNFIDLSPLLFFLMSLAKGFSQEPVFSFIDLFSCFLVSISFISDLIFMFLSFSYLWVLFVFFIIFLNKSLSGAFFLICKKEVLN